MKHAIKTLSLSVALILSAASTGLFAQHTVDMEVITATAEDMALKTLNETLGKPNAHYNLVKTNKHVFYPGDQLTIEVTLPSNLKALLNGTAELQMLLYFSTGNDTAASIVSAFPVGADSKIFDDVIDVNVLPIGAYQLGLVLVKPNGDARNIEDWYNGHSGLLSTTRLKISDNPGLDIEDSNYNGSVEGDGTEDGYVDMLGGEHEVCSNAVLEGTYTYIVNGLAKQGDVLKDYLEMGFDTFDGNGKMTSVHVDALNRATYHSTATYNIDQNCHGTVTYDDGGSFSMFVTTTGDEFFYLSVGDVAGHAVGGREHRISKKVGISCSTGTLKGVYSYAARGVKQGVLWIETGIEYFDGLGNVVNMYTNNVNKKTEYSRGTYVVGENCLGVTTYPNGNSAERYMMLVSPSGNEFNWIQIDGLQLLGVFGGVNNRTARAVEGFGELARFAASGTPLDPNFTSNMFCNMPTTIPEGVDIKCGDGYDVVDGACQLAPDAELDAVLIDAPAALCPAGIMLKGRD